MKPKFKVGQIITDHRAFNVKILEVTESRYRYMYVDWITDSSHWGDFRSIDPNCVIKVIPMQHVLKQFLIKKEEK